MGFYAQSTSAVISGRYRDGRTEIGKQTGKWREETERGGQREENAEEKKKHHRKLTVRGNQREKRGGEMKTGRVETTR